jgi:hypothetical protein
MTGGIHTTKVLTVPSHILSTYGLYDGWTSLRPFDGGSIPAR